MIEAYPDFYLTQTSTKDLEAESTCPTRWKGQWLDKVISFPSNEDMDKGKYFEWLCLGGGAISGEDVTDLPRTSFGKKTADQLRIEQQAERFKRMFIPGDSEFCGQEIIDTQVELRDDKNKHKGTLDFVTKDVTTHQIWVNDLKLTSDVTSTRSKYGWGNPWDQMDMLQMVHYRDLYANHLGTPHLKTALWVFDYTKYMRCKIGEIKISEKAKHAKDIRMSSAFEVIDLYEKNGWATVASEEECRRCPLSCVDRWKSPPVERFTINI
jgi:hypothetical protein